MYTLTINKHNIVNHHNEEIFDYDLYKYLRNDIEIGNDVTFNDIFNIIANNTIMFEIIFHSDLGGFKLKPFIDEINKEKNKDEFVSNIEYIKISRNFDDLMINSEYNSVDQYVEITGVGNDPESLHYSISLTPLYNLKDLPIKVSSKTNLGKQYFNMPISVYEFFSCILYELTWHGTPEMRDKFTVELEKTAEMIKSGEMKTYTLDELKNNLFEDDDDEI